MTYGDLLRLLGQIMWGKFEMRSRLRDADDEAVREAVDMDAVQRAHRRRAHCLGQRLAVAPDRVVAGTPRVVGADLEAGGEDQAVELVVLAVGPHARLVMRSTPLPSVSIRWTFGAVEASAGTRRGSTGRLQNWRYQGFSASAVAGSVTMASTRARISVHLLEVGSLHSASMKVVAVRTRRRSTAPCRGCAC